MNPTQNNLIGPVLPPVQGPQLPPAAQQATQTTTQPVVPVAKPDISGLISQTPDNSVITSADLKPVQQTQLPQPNQAVTSTPAPNYAQQFINTLEAPKTEAQGVQGNAINQILSNLGGLQGESTFRNEALEQQNYAQKLQEYQNINTQVLAKQADIELVRDLRNEERRDTLLPFAQLGQAKISGDATIKRALLNAEIGVLNASAIAKQGDINLAIYLANQAVETKYAPYRENIAMWESVLETIKPTLDADQQKQAAVQQIKADAAMREIEKEEQKEKSIQSLALEAAKNGAGAATIKAITASASMDDAILAAGSSIAQGNSQVVKLDNGNTLLIDGNTGKVIKNFGGAKSTGLFSAATEYSPLIDLASNLEGTVSGRKAVKEQLGRMMENENYTAAYAQIENTVENSLTGDVKQRFANARNLSGSITNIRSKVKEFEEAGGDTGLLVGKAEKIKRKLLGVTDNPLLTTLATELEREFQTYRNIMTGAAFTPAESADYESVNPSTGKSIDLNLAVIDGVLNQLNSQRESVVDARLPGASDIRNISRVPEKAAEAATSLNQIYSAGSEEAVAITEKLLDEGFSDQDVLDYLDSNNIQ